jgi:hypothetical protein
MTASLSVARRIHRAGVRQRFRLAVVLVVALTVVGGAVVAHLASGEEATAAATGADIPSHGAVGGMPGMTHQAGMVVVPAAPTDGVLTIVIPPGTDAEMKQSGDAGYHMPSVMRLHVGDTIVIRNEDTAPHMMLYTFLLPGQTDRRIFTAVGSEAYSSGCSANAATFPDFTTIFVVDR